MEFKGSRSANVSEKVSFGVQKTEKGVRVAIKGQPDTEEVIPLAVLKESINKAAYAYTDEHLGPKRRSATKSAASRTACGPSWPEPGVPSLP